jgi:proteasome lid subunit RPN8/RPN11
MDVDDTCPDVKQIERTETKMRPSPVRADETDSDFAIVLAAPTWAAIQKHAHTRLDAEVGGVLLGKLCRDSRETPYLLIDGHVAALEAESRASNVTFTAESWTTIHESIDRDFPGASIVGWYHTHPSFGIFLSEMDVFIHRHFFEAPHQVAIVIDPVANTHGGFAWRAGTPQPQTLLIESSDAVPPPIDLTETFRRRLRERDARANAIAAMLKPRRSFVRFASWMVVCLVAFAACCYALIKWTPLVHHVDSLMR